LEKYPFFLFWPNLGTGRPSTPLPFPPSGLLRSARWRPSRTPPAPAHYRAARLGTATRSSRARLLLLPLTAPWPHSSAHTRTRTRKSPTALLGLPTAPLAPRVRLPHALLFPSLTASWDPRQPPTRTSRPLSRCPAGPPVSRPRSLSFSSPTRSEPFLSLPRRWRGQTRQATAAISPARQAIESCPRLFSLSFYATAAHL